MEKRNNTAYIVTDIETKCNTFPKKFEISSLFITIRVCPWNFGIIQQKTAKSSAFLPLSPEFSRFVGLYSADFTGNGRVSRAKFVTPPKGLGRFRRESSNLGREAYKGTSSPKVGDRKSPYEIWRISKKFNRLPSRFQKFGKWGLFSFLHGLFRSRQM